MGNEGTAETGWPGDLQSDCDPVDRLEPVDSMRGGHGTRGPSAPGHNRAIPTALVRVGRVPSLPPFPRRLQHHPRGLGYRLRLDRQLVRAVLDPPVAGGLQYQVVRAGGQAG